MRETGTEGGKGLVRGVRGGCGAYYSGKRLRGLDRLDAVEVIDPICMSPGQEGNSSRLVQFQALLGGKRFVENELGKTFLIREERDQVP